MTSSKPNYLRRLHLQIPTHWGLRRQRMYVGRGRVGGENTFPSVADLCCLVELSAVTEIFRICAV